MPEPRLPCGGGLRVCAATHAHTYIYTHTYTHAHTYIYTYAYAYSITNPGAHVLCRWGRQMWLLGG